MEVYTYVDPVKGGGGYGFEKAVLSSVDVVEAKTCFNINHIYNFIPLTYNMVHINADYS